ncbi:hypothetical protein L209DRAFT_503693 [Thermothelomyces heterothallicus CBS 203.75]
MAGTAPGDRPRRQPPAAPHVHRHKETTLSLFILTVGFIECSRRIATPPKRPRTCACTRHVRITVHTVNYPVSALPGDAPRLLYSVPPPHPPHPPQAPAPRRKSQDWMSDRLTTPCPEGECRCEMWEQVRWGAQPRPISSFLDNQMPRPRRACELFRG